MQCWGGGTGLFDAGLPLLAFSNNQLIETHPLEQGQVFPSGANQCSCCHMLRYWGGEGAEHSLTKVVWGGEQQPAHPCPLQAEVAKAIGLVGSPPAWPCWAFLIPPAACSLGSSLLCLLLPPWGQSSEYPHHSAFLSHWCGCWHPADLVLQAGWRWVSAPCVGPHVCCPSGSWHLTKHKSAEVFFFFYVNNLCNCPGKGWKSALGQAAAAVGQKCFCCL